MTTPSSSADSDRSPVTERTHAALFHGRYLSRPAPEAGAPLLVGFHGYGETAERLLEELETIPGVDGWHVVSVAAPHPFYTRQGDVVASWMTKQHRELAIEDNIRYAASVISEVRRDHDLGPTTAMAGFSQGVAMAYRAAARSGHPCHGLVALAGDVPPAIGAGAATLPPVLLGRGRDDTWYDEAKMDADVRTLEERGTPVEALVFDGGHEWTDPFREAAARFLAGLLAD